MKPRRPRAIAFLAAAATAMAGWGAFALADQDPRDVNLVRSGSETQPPQAAPSDGPVDPFGRVRYIEGGARVLRTDGAEDLGFNAPVYKGDRVETAGDGQRVELQLPDGSLVRLDIRSSVELYDFAAPGDGDGATVLGLSAGSLAADVPNPNGGQNFRIDTPAASVYPTERAAFRVDIEDNDAVRVSVEHGAVEVAGQDGTVVVRAGERTRVRAGEQPRRPWDYNVMIRDGFDGWVARRDDVYALREQPGKEYGSLPAEVRPYYGELSRYGHWVYTDEFGWTWKPDNVSGDWRPYYEGEWDYGPGGPVWVGSEPWGWAVYRYGRWNFRVGLGWLWIPGAVFGPAHVYWYYGPSYVGWCPLDFWNYPVYVGLGWGWGDPWFDGYPWGFVRYHDFWGRGMHGRYIPRNAVIPRDLRGGYVGRSGLPLRNATRIGEGGVRGVRDLPQDSFQRIRDAAARNAGRGFSPVEGRAPINRAASPARTFRDVERTQIGGRQARTAPSVSDRFFPQRGADQRQQPGAASTGRTATGRDATSAGRDATSAGRDAGATRTPPDRGGSGRPATGPGRRFDGGADQASPRPPDAGQSRLPSFPRSPRADATADRGPQAERGAGVSRLFDRISPASRGDATRGRAASSDQTRAEGRSATADRPRYEARPTPSDDSRAEGRSATADRPRYEARPTPSEQPRSETRTAPSDRPRYEARPAPSEQPRSETRTAPAERPRYEARPAPSESPRSAPSAAPRSEGRSAPSAAPRSEARSAPAARSESRGGGGGGHAAPASGSRGGGKRDR